VRLEQCGAIVRMNGAWSDVMCEDDKHFVCQMAAPDDQPCPEDYPNRTSVIGTCWTNRRLNRLNYADALADCRSIGGHLPIIRNRADDDYYMRMMTGHDESWLGMDVLWKDEWTADNAVDFVWNDGRLVNDQPYSFVIQRMTSSSSSSSSSAAFFLKF